MNPNPVVWFEIYVADMARARRFYETVLGAPLSKLDGPDADVEMWSFPMKQDGSGAGGALARMAGVSPGGGGTLVYFGCDDCAVEAGRVAGAGGRVERPKSSIGPYGHIALVVDTEGNMIGLHSMN
jgi:predicted enzyme related to lactoylglutathione lyase